MKSAAGRGCALDANPGRGGSRFHREPAAVWGIDSATEPAGKVGFGASFKQDSGMRLRKHDGLFVGTHSTIGEKFAQRQAQITRMR